MKINNKFIKTFLSTSIVTMTIATPIALINKTNITNTNKIISNEIRNVDLKDASFLTTKNNSTNTYDEFSFKIVAPKPGIKLAKYEIYSLNEKEPIYNNKFIFDNVEIISDIEGTNSDRTITFKVYKIAGKELKLGIRAYPRIINSNNDKIEYEKNPASISLNYNNTNIRPTISPLEDSKVELILNDNKDIEAKITHKVNELKNENIKYEFYTKETKNGSINKNVIQYDSSNILDTTKINDGNVDIYCIAYIEKNGRKIQISLETKSNFNINNSIQNVNFNISLKKENNNYKLVTNLTDELIKKHNLILTWEKKSNDNWITYKKNNVLEITLSKEDNNNIFRLKIEKNGSSNNSKVSNEILFNESFNDEIVQKPDNGNNGSTETKPEQKPDNDSDNNANNNDINSELQMKEYNLKMSYLLLIIIGIVILTIMISSTMFFAKNNKK